MPGERPAKHNFAAALSGKLPVDHRIWRALVFALFAVTILRGIRYPDDYGFMQFVFNYDFGVIRRGIIGEVATWLGAPFFRSYSFYLLLMTTLFIANITLIALILRDMLASRQPALIGSALVFASGLSLVYLAHTIGYFDQIGLLIILASFRIQTFNRKLIYFAITVPIALLIHEGFLLIYFPLAFVTLMMTITPNDRRQMIALAVFTAATLALTYEISQWGTFSNSLMEKATAHWGDEVGFEFSHNLAKLLLVYNMDQQWSYRERYFDLNANHASTQIWDAYAKTVPTFLLFLYLIARRLQRSAFDDGRKFLILASPFSVQILLLFGVDINRWNTLSVTVCFLLLYFVWCKAPPSPPRRKMKKKAANAPPKNREPPPLTPPFFWLIVLALVIAAATPDSYYLFDDFKIKNLPFDEHFTYLSDLLSGAETIPTQPPY